MTGTDASINALRPRINDFVSQNDQCACWQPMIGKAYTFMKQWPLTDQLLAVVLRGALQGW